MNEPLSETEKAWRDTLLNLCDDESFDIICRVYEWPRPEWIPRENWRRAIRVATYGPKGTFNTLRAFCQAAFSFMQVGIPYYRFVKDFTGAKAAWEGLASFKGQKEIFDYSFGTVFRTPWVNPNFDPPAEHEKNYDEAQLYDLGLHTGGVGGNQIRFDPHDLPEDAQKLFFRYPTNIHRDVLLRGNDGNYRLHRILYEHADNKFAWRWFLARGSTAYWRGFPDHTWWPYKNHKPFKKAADEKTEPTPYADGNVNVGLDTERISDEQCYLLPFTFTEPSVGVYKGWNQEWPEVKDKITNGGWLTYKTPNRVQENFKDSVCTVRLHTFFQIPGLGNKGVPPTYTIGANVESDRDIIGEAPFPGADIKIYKSDYYAKIIIALPQNWNHPVSPTVSPEHPAMYTDENGVLLPEHYPGGWDARRILAPHNNFPSHYWYWKPMGPRVPPNNIGFKEKTMPGAGVEPGGKRRDVIWDPLTQEGSAPGQEHGGQLLGSDLDKGHPYNEDGEVAKSGMAPEKMEGPYPPYLRGGESIESVSELLTAFAKLLPSGVTLEIVPEYGPLYARYYDWETDAFMIWGKDIDPATQTAKTNTNVPIYDNPDVVWDDDFNDE